MNRNTTLARKVIYVAAIALLLYPLFRLGQPASSDGTGGGALAKLRAKHDLAQAKLGDIDPASETMKLATLGMRGVAAQILWKKSEEYKMKEDWDNFTATLNQITRLQPNFILVWEFQAHNVSYNVSVEFDDYRHRYQWVKRGIGYLIEGTHYNRNEPRLLWYTGWFFGQKLGKADEFKQFRRLFRADEDFHLELRDEVAIESREARSQADYRPDNWLVSRLWYLQAQRAVDSLGKPIRRTSPLVFHADIAKPRVNFAMAIEEEGILDEVAEVAWQDAGNDWHKFGDREITSSWGHLVRMNSVPQLIVEREALRSKLDELVPGLREKILAERQASLTPEELAARATPFDKMTEEKIEVYRKSISRLQVGHKDVVDRLPEELKAQGRTLAARLQEMEFVIQHVETYRGIINYPYWETRCKAEQKPEAVAARKHIFAAEQALKDADLEKSKKEFESAWQNWAQVFAEFPALMDAITGDELNEVITKYEQGVLHQLGLELPADFPLKALRQRHTAKQFRQPGSDIVPAADQSPTDGKSPADGKQSPIMLRLSPPPAETQKEKDEAKSKD